MQFKISPFSFWQINRKQAEKLYGKAKEYANLKSDEILLDLYCGTGTIGLTMADSCKQLIGAEIVEDAVKDANENAKANGIEMHDSSAEMPQMPHFSLKRGLKTRLRNS